MSRARVGFLGVGWIGRHRMEAMLATGAIDCVGIADPSAEMAGEAVKLAPGARCVGSLDALLDLGLDGVVIATPSALHAEQSIAALERGVAVFCQKPLGRTEAEVQAVIDAAKTADRLLGVDLSYRFTAGMQAIREKVQSGALGRIYAANLVFHNAYGPDKPWFYDAALSGGGCVMDLGVHLVDLLLWTLDFPDAKNVSARLFSGGQPLRSGSVEDYAAAMIDLAGGTTAQLACSWRLPAGQDAVISAEFYGTEGGAALRNVNGSFYDFTAELFFGTYRETLTTPPDAWGGRAAAAWAEALAAKEGFAGSTQGIAQTTRILDRIYGREPVDTGSPKSALQEEVKELAV
ncbi:MAG TPA: Gfo/Idh/MocA family oxidoreductase [Allosphingosinicella sp.]